MDDNIEQPYQEDHSELSKAEKFDLWQTSFGLQAVDNLKPSAYLRQLANDNINGHKDYQEIEQNLHDYYHQNQIDPATRESEADLVSLRITELLADRYFIMGIGTILAIHRHLFNGVLINMPVGQFRTINITKSEAVLNGASVQYASHFLIETTLEYDFNRERKFQLGGLDRRALANHIMHFIADIWQVHPFREGNTRTIAVFAIKYLQSVGFQLKCDPFQQHSRYFRDALVLANANYL